METRTDGRQEIIDELNVLTEKKWDLIDELGALELTRAALFNRLKDMQDGNG